MDGLEARQHAFTDTSLMPGVTGDLKGPATLDRCVICGPLDRYVAPHGLDRAIAFHGETSGEVFVMSKVLPADLILCNPITSCNSDADYR